MGLFGSSERSYSGRIYLPGQGQTTVSCTARTAHQAKKKIEAMYGDRMKGWAISMRPS